MMHIAKPIPFGTRILILLVLIGSVLFKIKPLRKLWIYFHVTLAFLIAAFSSKGIWKPEGRQLIRGKFRRLTQSISPAIAGKLQRRLGTEGGCSNCGASCNLLNQCPLWNSQTRLCTVYKDRPNICRTFPITPADIRDRNLVQKHSDCGFYFSPLQ